LYYNIYNILGLFICDTIIMTINSAEEEYEQLRKIKIKFAFHWNLSNILALHAKIMDIIAFSKIAFENNVTWIPFLPSNDPELAK